MIIESTEQKESVSSRAWLLDFGKGLRAAVGAHEMSQVLLATQLHEVPCTPFYANEVFIFQESILPMLDVAALITGHADDMAHLHVGSNIIGLALYQLNPTDPAHYAGLRLTTLPVNIFVADDQFCELPTRLSFWQPAAISCFKLNDTEIPIIDLAKLFSGKVSPADFQQTALNA